MKKNTISSRQPFIYLLFLLFLVSPASIHAQIEQVIVEKYYISEANDTLDPLGAKLEEGSVTYRIFLDLASGYALKSLIGDSTRPFLISSTANFFNHIQGFGIDLGSSLNSAYLQFGIMGLDSWLTLGYATTEHMGVPKTSDTDGSKVGGSFSGGYISAENQEAGVPVTSSDGMIAADSLAGSFQILTSISDSTFGIETHGKQFLYTGASGGEKYFLTTGKGAISGPESSNIILVGQLTTKGELAFILNCELIDTSSNESYFIYGTDSLIDFDKNEVYSPMLKYPQQCGCTDPFFAEYDPNASCDDGSCRDSILLGCMDPLACNYDPLVNFSVAELCCYGPENCDNRNIEVVCPGYPSQLALKMFPNPVLSDLNYEISSSFTGEATIRVRNAYGSEIKQLKLEIQEPLTTGKIDVSGLNEGIYILEIMSPLGYSSRKQFIRMH